jgi:hypothetical protein
MPRTALPAFPVSPRARVSRPRSIATAAASLLPLLAAPSFSAPFGLLVVDNGGQRGTLGQPIVPSAGAFYRTPQVASVYGLPPTRDAVSRFPLAEFSSYLAMGGSPVTLQDAANPPANFIGPQFDGLVSGESGGPTQVSGVRYNFPIVVVDPVANPYMASPTLSVSGAMGPDTVFLGRLTVKRGEHPVGTSIVLGATFNPLSRGQKGRTATIRAELDGPAQIIDPPGNTPTTALLVKSRLAAQVTIPAWGDADVYDLYAVSESDLPKASKLAKTAKPKAKAPPKSKQTIKAPSRDLIPDTADIQYGRHSGGAGATPTKRGSDSPSPSAEPEPVLVREILKQMGVQ